MKKVIIISLAILLTKTFCFGQGIEFENPKDKLIKLHENITDITLKNTKGKELTVTSSNNAIVEYNSITYSNDSSIANIVISGKEYGYANIEVTYINEKGETETIARKIIVTNIDNIVAISAMSDIITSIRPQLSQAKTLISKLESKIKELESKEEETKIQSGELPYNIISYILAALLLGFGLVLFIFYKKNKTYKKEIAELRILGECYELEAKKRESNLSNENSTLSAKIKKLKNDNLELRTEIYQCQQRKNISDEQKQQPATPIEPQSLSLYADAIIDGKFNRVTEQPDNNSIFELKLERVGDTKAEVIIYPDAYRRVIANPSFLEGCKKHILGNTTVTILQKGVATIDNNGKWKVESAPEVKVS